MLLHIMFLLLPYYCLITAKGLFITSSLLHTDYYFIMFLLLQYYYLITTKLLQLTVSLLHGPPACTFPPASDRPLRPAVAACVREQGCVAVCPSFGPGGGPTSTACSIGQPLADASGQAGKGAEKSERSLLMGQTRLIHVLA